MLRMAGTKNTNSLGARHYVSHHSWARQKKGRRTTSDHDRYSRAGSNRGSKEGGEAAVYKGNQAVQDID